MARLIISHSNRWRMQRAKPDMEDTMLPKRNMANNEERIDTDKLIIAKALQ